MTLRLLLALVAVFSAAAGADSSDRIERIEKGLRPEGKSETRWAIAERMARYNVPAASLAVVNQGRIEWAKAYGILDETSKRATGTDTLFQAASISKPVSAIAALRLVARGQLALDEDVNGKLRSWKVPRHSFSKPVTLRGLLSHSAGMTVHGFPGYRAGAPVPSLIELLNGGKPANTPAIVVEIEPGSKFRYSGGGYSVMQLLVQDVTGKPFAEAMKDLVLDPLEMTRSSFEQPLPERLAPNAARAHRGDGSAVAGRWHTYPEQAAAGLWTTPSDLARVLIAVHRADHGDSRLLPANLTREMLTRQKENYGLGWALAGEADSLAFLHGGSNAGFRCAAWCFVKQRLGAVVMTNGDGGGALAGEILRSIAAEYGWPDRRIRMN